MGRKLRFDARKNSRRKKHSKKQATVVSERHDLPLKFLPVSLPLSAYTGAVVPNIATLHSRLGKLPELLPLEWKCERPPDYSEHALDIFKTGYDSASRFPKMIFSLQVQYIIAVMQILPYYNRYIKIFNGLC